MTMPRIRRRRAREERLADPTAAERYAMVRHNVSTRARLAYLDRRDDPAAAAASMAIRGALISADNGDDAELERLLTVAAREGLITWPPPASSLRPVRSRPEPTTM